MLVLKIEWVSARCRQVVSHPCGRPPVHSKSSVPGQIWMLTPVSAAVAHLLLRRFRWVSATLSITPSMWGLRFVLPLFILYILFLSVLDDIKVSSPDQLNSCISTSFICTLQNNLANKVPLKNTDFCPLPLSLVQFSALSSQESPTYKEKVCLTNMESVQALLYSESLLRAILKTLKKIRMISKTRFKSKTE